ncbi:MAG TPA: amino acid adenylation domain-containing protein [Methanocorpusculum sp.]|nr:amino acid adenylation domain-containing protein [Methanocorpusculum sp.]
MTVSITQWLDKTADAFPNKPAIIDEAETISWHEYHKYAQTLARAVIDRGLCQKPVAVYLKKSARVLVSFAAIAYARCFYTPIDANQPKARIEKILSNLEPSLIITDKNLADEAAQFGVPLLILDEIKPDAGDSDCVIAVQKQASAKDLLYVLFTSGSTGEPKGVSITHRSVINYINWVVKTFQITKDDSFANQAPFFFDNSILDIYSCMQTGAELHIVPGTLFSQPVRLLSYLKDEKITTIFWVPSALIGPARLKAFRNVDLSGTLRRVLFCGEVMPVKQLNVWRQYLPDVLYANLYGPTEITDACTCYIVDRNFSDEEALPIGKAIDNCEVFLLNGDKPVVQGEEGEICVSGVCLSPGYYQSPERTAEVFVQNPLSKSADIIYRTGDIGKVNTLGELMYICRKDAQIKYLGHRIEPGEIDTAAGSLLGVESCCTVFDRTKNRIVLFYEGEANPEYVAENLARLLPDYMLPAKILRRTLPRTPNGKCDRMRLMEELK